MANENVAGRVMVAFKPEIGKSEIEKVLEGYTYEQVFKNGEFDSATDITGQMLARIYSLSVPVGNEARVLEELNQKYGQKIEMAYQPPVRKK